MAQGRSAGYIVCRTFLPVLLLLAVAFMTKAQDVQLTVMLIHTIQGDERVAGHMSSHKKNLANKDRL